MIERRAPASRAGRVVLVTLVAVVALAGCAGATPGPPSEPAPSPPAAPVTVPVSVVDGGTRMVVDITVGGAPLRVLVDTGSAGLRVLAGKVPTGATPLGPAPTFSYGSGVELAGTLARAPLRIGSVTSPNPVPIELITAVRCVPDRPRCPAAGGHAPEAFGGELDGILGIGPAPADPPTPLWFLGPVGHTVTVHDDPAGPRLVLSGPPDGFVQQHLAAIRPAVDDAPPGWQPRPPACASGPSVPGGRICGPTLWDTGTSGLARFRGLEGAAPSGSTLTVGTADGRWSVGYPVDAATPVRTSSTVPSSIAGLAAFTRVDVRWDLDAGTIGFRTR